MNAPDIPRNAGLTKPLVFGAQARATKKEKVFAAGLMHQQCWCWGQDVATSGNLLLRFGFTRHRRPGVTSGGAGGTRYEIEQNGLRVALWGFGMWLRLPTGEQGYFARYERGVWLLPKSFEVSEVHSGRQLEPQLTRPLHTGEVNVAHKLASAAAAWCERYERWVIESAGLPHRQRTLSKWKHAVVDPGDMASAWRRTRDIYERCYPTKSRVEAWVASPRLDGAARDDFALSLAAR
ncbi:MAG: hypothetical protein AAGF84_11640 [Planctomycetota bacterium]